MQQHFEDGVYGDRQTRGFDNQHCNPFVQLNNTHAHTHVAVDPLSSGEISRAAFIGRICLKAQRHFKGGDISRKYMCTCTLNSGNPIQIRSAFSTINSSRTIKDGIYSPVYMYKLNHFGKHFNCVYTLIQLT